MCRSAWQAGKAEEVEGGGAYHTQSKRGLAEQSTDKAYSGQQFSGGIHQYAKHVLLSSNGKCFIFTYDRPKTELETKLQTELKP